MILPSNRPAAPSQATLRAHPRLPHDTPSMMPHDYSYVLDCTEPPPSLNGHSYHPRPGRQPAFHPMKSEKECSFLVLSSDQPWYDFNTWKMYDRIQTGRQESAKTMDSCTREDSVLCLLDPDVERECDASQLLLHSSSHHEPIFEMEL